MRVSYLTWGETPRAYGVFASQVIGQFCKTCEYLGAENVDFSFVSAIPLVHSGFVREKFSYRKELGKVEAQLKDNNVSFKRLPIFAPQNFVNSTQGSFKYFHGFNHFALRRYFQSFAPEIVHCRSYHATYAALKVRDALNADYKVIFDARGIWPLEVTLKRRENLDSSNLHFLLGIQKYCLDNSDRVIGVSDIMSNYFKSKTDTKVETIYLSANTAQLSTIHRESLISKDNLVYCYLGALSSSTWHRPKELCELFRRLKSINQNSKLMIITTSPRAEYIDFFDEFEEEDILYRSSSNIEQLKVLLATCDIGLMSYFTPENEIQKELGASVLAVKTAEYLAAGMPMLVNQYCGGAAALLEKNNVGVSYDPENLNLFSEGLLAKLLKVSPSKAKAIAKEYLDYSTNSARYAAIYNELLSND